ncbi:unnamed protein product [Caretta caretta]
MSDLLEFVNHSNSGYLLNANEGKKLREDGQPANGSLSFCQSISEVSLGPVLEEDASRYQLIRYRKAANIAHCEYAALLVKNSSLQTEEKDEAVLTKNTFERNNTILLERLKDKQIAWDNCCQELLHKEKKFTELDRALHASMYETKTTQTLYQTFISQLATLLSNTFITVAGTEEAIKERIQEIRGSEHSWKSHMGFLQELTEKLQINQVSSPESLHCQYEMLLDKAEQLSKLDTEYQTRTASLICRR